MKGLVVNPDKSISLKSGLIVPISQENEVLIEVKSASVNPFDAESAHGRFDAYFEEYGVNKEVQSGLEFSGIVLEDGKRFKKGDKVFGYVHMITGCKSHAQYLVIDEGFIALKPAALSHTQAASMPLGALTSLIALQDIGKLKAGMKLLINGAAGGLGIQATQIGKILGAHVTVFAGTGQSEYLKAHGADVVYDYNQTSITDIQCCFDVILDFTNVQTLLTMRPLLTESGVFIPAEPNAENGGESEDAQVGYLMVAHGDHDRLTVIAKWVAEGKLIPVIDSEFSFENYQRAFERVEQKGRKGRIVLNW